MTLAGGRPPRLNALRRRMTRTKKPDRLSPIRLLIGQWLTRLVPLTVMIRTRSPTRKI